MMDWGVEWRMCYCMCAKERYKVMMCSGCTVLIHVFSLGPVVNRERKFGLVGG